MSDFKAMNKGSIVDEVQDQMMGKIMDGTWSQGDKIPSENELRDMLGVSRDTVRQAIKRMCALGLLESQQGRGTFVQNIDLSLYLTHMVPLVFLSEDDGTNLLQYMQVIQVASAKAAVDKATQEDIQALTKCLEEMMRESEDEEYYQRDAQFHICLSRCSHNPLFVKSMEITSHMLTYYLTNLVRIHGRDQSIQDHKQCLDAIMKKDSAAAMAAMHQHYSMLEQRLVHSLGK